MPPPDRRLSGKERVLGIPAGDGGIAFPFGELDERGDHAVVTETVDGRELVVLWSRAAHAARAYQPFSQTGAATLSVEHGGFVDRESRSVWTVEGVAVYGPRVGERLAPVPEAFVAFWFAWSAFHPETALWRSS